MDCLDPKVPLIYSKKVAQNAPNFSDPLNFWIGGDIGGKNISVWESGHFPNSVCQILIQFLI